MLLNLWDDDCGGALLSSELLFLFSTLVLGTLSGMVAVRQAVLAEMSETAQSLLSANQSHSLSGQSNCEGSAGGAAGSDTSDTIGLGRLGRTGPLVSQTPMD
jgi:hypothetical protein